MSKADQVYHTLRQAIVSGEFSPGYRLIIDALARDLGVSAMPVREAMRRLEAEGLVRYRANVGAEVARLNHREYGEMLSVAAHLDGWAVALAAPGLAPADLDPLTTCTHAMQDALDHHHLRRFAVLEWEFHHQLRALCPNRFLADLAERCWARRDPGHTARFFDSPNRTHAALAAHYHLLQSLREHAPPPMLAQLVEEHMLMTWAPTEREPVIPKGGKP